MSECAKKRAPLVPKSRNPFVTRRREISGILVKMAPSPTKTYKTCQKHALDQATWLRSCTCWRQLAEGSWVLHVEFGRPKKTDFVVFDKN